MCVLLVVLKKVEFESTDIGVLAVILIHKLLVRDIKSVHKS